MEALGSVRGLAERRGVAFDPTDRRAIRSLDDASAFIRNYTHQTITTVEEDVVALNGTGIVGILLPEIPVVGVTEVSLVTDWAESATPTVLETSTYRVDDRVGLLVRGGCDVWDIGIANVLVTYDHGYATVPEGIASVAYELAATNYVSFGSGVVTQEQILSYQVTYEASTVGQASLPDWCEEILAVYRTPV